MKSNGSVPTSLYYVYDDDGRRTKIEPQQVATQYATYFGYDDASRLVSEEWLDGGGDGVYAFEWEYDAAGNRTEQTRNGVTTEYDYNTLNQLTHEVTDGAHTYYTYDADGQLASRQDGGGTTEFAWDFESRMREAVLPDETTWDYRYSLGSQRWRKRKVDEEERTDFIYDGEKVAEEHDYSGANQATYTHAGSSIYSPLLAQRADEGSAWFLQDALGSTMALMDSDEALLLQVLYDAWGNELLSNGNGQTPYRYVGAYGYYQDVETDLLYLWMRYYDPRVGRFTRRDPGGVYRDDAYGYLSDSPVLAADATGLFNYGRGIGGRIGAGGGLPGAGGGAGVSAEVVIDGSRLGVCFTVAFYPSVIAGGVDAGTGARVGVPDIPGLAGPGATVGLDLGTPIGGGGEIELAGCRITDPSVTASAGVGAGPGFFGYAGATYTWCFWLENVPLWLRILGAHAPQLALHYLLARRLIRGVPIVVHRPGGGMWTF